MAPTRRPLLLEMPGVDLIWLLIQQHFRSEELPELLVSVRRVHLRPLMSGAIQLLHRLLPSQPTPTLQLSWLTTEDQAISSLHRKAVSRDLLSRQLVTCNSPATQDS